MRLSLDTMLKLCPKGPTTVTPPSLFPAQSNCPSAPITLHRPSLPSASGHRQIGLAFRRAEQHSVVDDEAKLRLRIAHVAVLPEVGVLHFDTQALQRARRRPVLRPEIELF